MPTLQSPPTLPPQTPGAPGSPNGATPPPRGWRQRAAARGTLFAYAAVVVAVLIVINVVVSRHDHSWDLTQGHVHSLSPESVKVMRDLRQPLRLIYFDHSINFSHAKQFLSRYARQSNYVQLRFVDPDRHPDLARRYKIESYGTTAVVYAGRQQLVNDLNEQDVTNAIVRVLKGGRKTVYFILGEGERSPDDTGRAGYSALKAAMVAENFTVKTLILAQHPQIPADCAVLVLAGPTHPMVKPEVQSIAGYLQNGGRALFLVNIAAHGPLIQYLSQTLNVALKPDVVADLSGVGRLFGASKLMPIIATYDPQPITNQMGHLVTIFPFARTVSVGNSTTSQAQVTPLLETTPQSFAATDIANGEIRIDPSKDQHGPLTLGVAGTLPASRGKSADTEGRFVVYGSPDIAANAFIGFGGNKDLALNTFNWLSAQTAFISIRPHAAHNTPINLNAQQMHTIFWLVLVALPLFLILCGVAVWWRRRAA
ncbi:MAG: GldG family protein [Terriglobales bacterium]